MMQYDAVVLAGSDREAWLQEEGVNNKALLPIDGKPLVRYVLEAVRGSRYHGRTILVADFPPHEELKPLVDIWVEAGNSLEENIRRGVKMAKGPLVMIVGSDIPFLEASDIDRFVQFCLANPAYYYIPVIRKEDIEARFPGTRRTYATMKEGKVKAGNLVIFSIEAYDLVERFMSEVIAGRKQIWKLARIFGVKQILKFALGILTIRELEQVSSHFIGKPGRATIINAPGMGVDIDKPEDLILARAILEK
jgi:GTP:adenosylcobinamide-phosphate guanylyltransferase